MKTILIITILCGLIGLTWLVVLIVRGFKNARTMPDGFEVLSRAEMASYSQHLDRDCQDEFSPEAYFGSDDKEIEREAERLKRICESDSDSVENVPLWKDYNDEDIDTNFTNGLV